MKEIESSRKSRVHKVSRLTAQLVAVTLSFAALSTHATAVAPPLDLGVVAPSTTVSVVVWLKGSNSASLDQAVAALNDPASTSYHQWMQDADIAAYKPSAQDLATAIASLTAQGLSIDKVLDGGGYVRVSGTSANLQAAFGTTIHVLQTSTGRTLYKSTSAPAYKGAHAELIGGVSGLGGTVAKPFVARQMDLATGLPMPGVVPQAGTDPLAAFTTNCFGPDQTEQVKGFGRNANGGGIVVSTINGPTYLDPTTLIRPSCAYTAQQLVAHYGVNEAHAVGLKGRGQTIVIVDAYGSPTALADLNTFSSAMGLPAMTSKTFEVVYPDGTPTDTDPDWATETTLDIEWAHAFAPEAKIVLVVAPSFEEADLAHAVDYAADHRLGNVISASWGEPEAKTDKSAAEIFNHAFTHAAARGVAVNVATGDNADNGVGTPVGAPAVPADSLYATAVGGTSINIPSDNGPVESAWGLSKTVFGTNIDASPVPQVYRTVQGGGGGESVYFKKPSWQHKLPGAGRQTPDISAIADPQTGAIVVQSAADGTPVWHVIGGTSLATPIFSAIWALADEAAGESLGQAAPVIASLPPFAIRDVLPIKATKHAVVDSTLYHGVLTQYTAPQLLDLSLTQKTGFASFMVLVGTESFPGWNDIGFGLDASLAATVGWDNATGYGVPNGLLFIESAQIFARHH